VRFPPLACDAHCHVFGPAAQFPYAKDAAYVPRDAPFASLRALHDKLGLERAVIVHASCHGADMRATLDAISRSGGRYRGTAIIDASYGEREFRQMHEGGIRAVRFNFVRHLGGWPDMGFFAATVDRLKALGWHLILHLDASDLEALGEVLGKLPVPFVIDHMGRVQAAGGLEQKPFKTLLDLMKNPLAWVKISGAERVSAQGPPFTDAVPFARAIVAAAPERVLWGTDWPHPNVKWLPDDGALAELFAKMVPDRALQTAILMPAMAWAQAFPSKPIRLVVPFGAGGVADLTARIVAPRIAEGLGQPIVVENKPGAGGVLAAQEVARATPDGHTVLLISNGNAVSQALFKSLPYDPENDFAMVSSLGFFPLVILADAKSPLATVADIVAEAKKQPGRMNIGTIAIGSTQNLAAELFRSSAALDAQIVPYKATGEVVAALKSGDAALAFEILAPALAHIRSGNLRAIAITSAKRFASLPNVPTAQESGIAGYDVASWNGFALPAKAPRAAIERLQQEVEKAVAAPEVQKRFAELGVEGRSSTPEELRAFFLREARKWGRVVEAAKIPRQ
jgi:tripartite-type tricarboxylate transporter receptor subunit TctC/predicted TIM-barrel fold metal-dependent hydrolase